MKRFVLFCSILLLFWTYVLCQKLFQRGGVYLQRSAKKRIAVLWVFTGALPSYWKWSLATLLNGGSEKLDVHIICGEDPINYNNQIWNEGNISKRVFFHHVTPENWRNRISEKMGINVKYNLAWCGRKVADFKPALGDLFQDFIPVKDYSWWVYGDSDGFFGSFENIVDGEALKVYDLVGGMTFSPENHQVLLAENTWHPGLCTGAWTMIRNAPYFNQLYQRSKDWQSIFNDSNFHHFDEAGRRLENMNTFLLTADDVRRCCMHSRSPSVLRQKSNDEHHTNQVFIAAMSSRFLGGNSTVKMQWKAHKGLSVNFVGNLGFSNSFRDETVNAMFFHFLQWKYCCPELMAALEQFSVLVESTKKQSIFSVTCFQLIVTSKNAFSFSLC